ncbi:MAG: hypothetical protein AAF480_14195 [Actinomycetota bacterium]
MSKQLRLIDNTAGTWRLDEHTKQVGRKGLAEARRALRESRPQYTAPDTQAA